MFILGLLSLLQVTFLPGFLFLKYGRIQTTSGLQTLVYSYHLSFLTNYLIACVFTFFQIYTSPVIHILLFTELALLSLHVWKAPKECRIWDPQPIRDFFRSLSWLNKIVILLTVLSTAAFIGYALKTFGTIFFFADEIGSYNNWAMQWTQNRMPRALDTMGYPISMSANWSIGYLIMGSSELQFFNKIATTFFPLTAVFILMDLARKQRSAAPLLAIPAFFLMLFFHTPLFIGAGPLDTVSACIALVAFYAILDFLDSSWSTQKLILIQLFAASAAAIKQSGLFVAIFALVFALERLYRKRDSLPRREIIRGLSWCVGIFLFLSLSWYIRIRYLIYQGLSTSESAYLIKGIHAGASYPERFLKAVNMFFGLNSPSWKVQLVKFCFFGGLIICAFASCAKKYTRITFLYLIIPYFFLWAFLFSYEIRTLALIFPFLAYCAAIGFYLLIRKFYSDSLPLPQLKSVQIRKASLVIFAGFSLSLVVILNYTVFSGDKLLQRQHSLQKQILIRDLNEKLYAFHEKEGIKGKIASAYFGIKFLPELKQFYFHLRHPTTYELLKYLEEREDISYLLVSIKPDERIYGFLLTEEPALKLIEENIQSGRYKLLFTHDNLGFIKIR